jgi:gas vesicle protein
MMDALSALTSNDAARWLMVQLNQLAPTDPNTPWMWVSGILAGAVVALFAALLKALTDWGNQWRVAAETAQKELPLTRETLNKATDTLVRQASLLEKMEDSVGTLARQVEQNGRDLAGLRELGLRVEQSLNDQTPARRRATGD